MRAFGSREAASVIWYSDRVDEVVVARMLAEETGRAVRTARRVHAGVSDAWAVTLDDGTTLFVKTANGQPRGWATAEAHGLGWLAEPAALRIPRVVAVRDAADGSLLALEWITEGKRCAEHDALLGRGLAALHRAGAPAFGLDRDGFLAGLPQPACTTPTIVELWGAHRLAPMLQRVADQGRASGTMKRGIERVLSRLAELTGPPEPPARLHGDLWAGNAITDETGRPVLVDPAVYGGHREIDLAMMRLFGGFSERVFDAYAEAFPLAADHEDRVALWQLYPLLVHVALFGGTYVASVERALQALV